MNTVSLEISVGVMPNDPEGLSITPELDLIKPALLYGDNAILYSPHIMILHHLDTQGSLSEEDFYSAIGRYSEANGRSAEEQEMEEVLANVERLQSKHPRTPEEEAILLAFSHFKKDVKQGYQEQIRPKIDKYLASTGYKQIRKAIKEGLLTVTPLTDENALFSPEREDVLIQSYFDHIEQIIQKPAVYPLLDTFSIDVVKALVKDGRLPESVVASKHGKQVGIATQLMRHAPTFPKADVYDIIDIRKDLRKPLIRFRSATIRLGELIESPVFGDEFEAEVSDLIIRDIDPAILEIQEAAHNNRYLKKLMNEATRSIGTVVTNGLTIGVASMHDFPMFLSAIASAISSATIVGKTAQIAVDTHKSKRETDQEIAKREMFFLTEMDRQLQHRSQRS